MSFTSPQDLGTPILLEDYIAVPPPITPVSPPLCAVCHSPNSPRRCSNCRSIHYCSPVCQTLNWALHKHLCKPFVSSASDDKKPDKSSRRALYLSATSAKPKFTWIKFGDDGRPLDMAKCFPKTRPGDIKTIAFHDRFLPYWIQISYVSMDVSGYSLAPNACVGQLLSTSSAALGSGTQGVETRKHTVWRGPLVVLAYSAEDGLSKPALDVDPGALGPVVQYLKLRSEYDGPVFVEQPQKRYSEAEWKELLGGLKQ